MDDDALEPIHLRELREGKYYEFDTAEEAIAWLLGTDDGASQRQTVAS